MRTESAILYSIRAHLNSKNQPPRRRDETGTTLFVTERVLHPASDTPHISKIHQHNTPNKPHYSKFNQPGHTTHTLIEASTRPAASRYRWRWTRTGPNMNPSATRAQDAALRRGRPSILLRPPVRASAALFSRVMVALQWSVRERVARVARELLQTDPALAEKLSHTTNPCRSSTTPRSSPPRAAWRPYLSRSSYTGTRAGACR